MAGEGIRSLTFSSEVHHPFLNPFFTQPHLQLLFQKPKGHLGCHLIYLTSQGYSSASLLTPFMERVNRRGFFSLQALRKGKEGPATTNPRGNPVPQEPTGDVVSLGLRTWAEGRPRCLPLQQRGLSRVNGRLQDLSRRWLCASPSPRVADSSFCSG